MSLTHIANAQPPKLNGKRYWRSLDELAATPEFKEWLHREFPEGASEMLSGSSRRTLLKLMAASLGLAGLIGCRRPEEKILPAAKSVVLLGSSSRLIPCRIDAVRLRSRREINRSFGDLQFAFRRAKQSKGVIRCKRNG